MSASSAHGQEDGLVSIVGRVMFMKSSSRIRKIRKRYIGIEPRNAGKQGKVMPTCCNTKTSVTPNTTENKGIIKMNELIYFARQSSHSMSAASDTTTDCSTPRSPLALVPSHPAG